MGLRGLAKKALPYVGAAVGAAFGAPQLGYAAGKGASAAIPGDKKSSGVGQTVYPTLSASSLDQARSQDKSRMRRQYPGL